MLSSRAVPEPNFQDGEDHQRSQWHLLDGEWGFRTDADNQGLYAKWQTGLWPNQASNSPEQTIQVPFSFQYPASRLKKPLSSRERNADIVWYEKVIRNIPTNTETRIVLRFDAVDYEATIWINGAPAGSHRGGHAPFELDITEHMSLGATDQFRITLRVYDCRRSLFQPRGKQSWHDRPESIWYTPTTGIWRSVWVGVVPQLRIGDSSHGTVINSTDVLGGQLRGKIALVGRQRAGESYEIKLETSFAGNTLPQSFRTDLKPDCDEIEFDLSVALSEDQWEDIFAGYLDSLAPDVRAARVAAWSPEYPFLYDLKITLSTNVNISCGEEGDVDVCDEITTCFGMRSIEWTRGDGTFRLNGKPFFQALVLDQAYWPESGMTPPSDNAEKNDILLAQAMGFNGCRKHQTLASPNFLYWADRLGFLVWSEIANAQAFTESSAASFSQEWTDNVRLGINHPSLIAWTPVNESWGYPDLMGSGQQRAHVRSLYHTTKMLDPTRPINDNCGWEHVVTDLSTFHDYSDGTDLANTCKTQKGIFAPKADRAIWLPPIAPSWQYPSGDEGSKHRTGAPILCTEFGGVNIAAKKKYDGSREGDWGYTTASDPTDLLARFEKLVLGIVEGGHICGFVYTQLADIEQEVNGLYTPERVAKLKPAEVKAIIKGAMEEYYNKLSG